MNKILAVFHKEYLETRTTTLIFWLVGVLCPLIRRLGLCDGRSVVPTLLNADPFAFGGIVAVWFNASILCAIAFAREKENGTFETLKRATPDWRVAAAGKFGYAFVSSLALAAFFGVASIIAATIGGHKPFEAFYRVLEYSPFGEILTITSDLAFASVCWGVFWTSRCSKQITAIFLACLSAFLTVSFVSNGMGIVFELSEPDSQSIVSVVVHAIVGAICLLALVAAPFKGRFGFHAQEQAVRKSEENQSKGSWNDVKLDDKKGSFSTLVSLVFTDAAILFKSPFSTLVELAILFATFALAFAVKRPENMSLTFILTLLLYYLCFASGLFLDSKKENSVVHTRLGFKPGAYWLANALAAFLVFVAAFAASYADFALFVPRGNVEKSIGLSLGIKALYAALIFAPFAVSLWSSALKGSRLVVGTTTFLVSVSVFLSLNTILYRVCAAIGDHGPKFPIINAKVVCVCLPIFMLTGLVFTVASYRIATRRALRRKAPWSVALPLMLTAAFVAYVAAPRLESLSQSSRDEARNQTSLQQTRENKELRGFESSVVGDAVTRRSQNNATP